MDAQPNPAKFILKNVYIVIPAADRSELLSRQLFQFTGNRDIPGRIVVKEGMFDPLPVLLPNAERNRSPYIIHDSVDMWFHFRRGDIQKNRLIAAGDIVADPCRIQLVFVGHHAADGNSVAQMMIRHQRNRVGFLGAVDNLIDSVVQRVAPNRYTANYLDSHSNLMVFKSELARQSFTAKLPGRTAMQA